MKRERELAEKRKNDPPLDLARDHPVRKLISRFRKVSDNKLSLTSTTDIERADLVTTLGNSHNHNNVNVTENNTKFINVNESPEHQETAPKPKEAVSRWGRFLAGAASGETIKTEDAAVAPPVPAGAGRGSKLKSTLTNNTSGGITSTGSVGLKSVASKPAPKAGAKSWGKLFGRQDRQDPIVEKAEEEEEMKLMKLPVSSIKSNVFTPRGGDKEQRMDHISEEQPPVTQRDIVCSVSGSTLSAAERQLISSLYDIKVEIKEEILTLNQKMTRIDDQITDILKMFSPRASPYSSSNTSSSGSSSQGSSTIGSSTSSSNTSNSSTASSSVVTSPRTSKASSPRKHRADVVASSSDSHSSSSSTGSTPPPGTTGSKKHRKASGRKKVAPVELDIISSSKDDENVPTKDKDLDIL